MLRRSFLSGVAALAATPVFAEGIFNPGANSVGDNTFGSLLGSAGKPPAAPLLLDALSVAPAVAYSTRKLRAAYAGSALRVQRSSDNTQLNIGFASNGQLDTAALLAFVGSGSAGVVTWFDQSTHAVNSSGSGAPPAIVNAGTVFTLNGNPAIRFGTVANAAMAVADSLPQPTTIATAVQANSQAVNSGITDGNTSSPRQLFGRSGGTSYQFYAGTGPLTGGTLDLLSHDYIAIFNGASSSLIIDGAAKISGNPGTNGIATQIIGAANGGVGSNTPMDGWMGEYIVFPSVLGSTDQATIRTSWQTQWGTQ